MSNLVERTALSGFTLSNMPVTKGQIVTLSPDQLASLAAAGCVHLDASANARVPATDLPPLRDLSAERTALDANLVSRRAAAEEEMKRIEQTLTDARQRSAEDILGIEKSTSERLEALGRSVLDAEAAADERKRAIAQEVEAARIAADEAVAAAAAKAEKAAKASGGRGA